MVLIMTIIDIVIIKSYPATTFMFMTTSQSKQMKSDIALPRLNPQLSWSIEIFIDYQFSHGVTAVYTL